MLFRHDERRARQLKSMLDDIARGIHEQKLATLRASHGILVSRTPGKKLTFMGSKFRPVHRKSGTTSRD
ncbi:MAG: hypothetical protein ACLSHG_01595 [Oscillospiraceae bacterium]